MMRDQNNRSIGKKWTMEEFVHKVASSVGIDSAERKTGFEIRGQSTTTRARSFANLSGSSRRMIFVRW